MKSKKDRNIQFPGKVHIEKYYSDSNQISIEILAVIVVFHFPMHQQRLIHILLTEKPFDSFQQYTSCADLN